MSRQKQQQRLFQSGTTKSASISSSIVFDGRRINTKRDSDAMTVKQNSESCCMSDKKEFNLENLSNSYALPDNEIDTKSSEL